MRVDVSNSWGNLGKQIDKLKDDIRKKVIAQALNDVVRDARTRMATEIAAEYNIPRAQAMEGLRIDKATAAAGKFFLSARLYAPSRPKGRGFNLIRFVEKKVTFAEAKRRKKAGTLNQLRVQIKRTGGLKPLPGAFIANGGRTVFIRTGKSRLPIKALTTVDVPQMFNTRKVNAKVVAFILARWPYALRDRLALLIKG